MNSKAAIREEIERYKKENSFKFKPKTGRSPKGRETELSIPIHERLIKKGAELRDSKQQKRETVSKILEKKNIQTKSTQMLEEKKRYILINVFEVLDSDQDGKISKDACDIESLNSDLKEFFAPLFAEMEERDMTLDKETFIDSSLRLYQKLTPTHRSKLLEAGRIRDRSAKEEDYSYSPSISQKSKQLAANAKTRELRLKNGFENGDLEEEVAEY